MKYILGIDVGGTNIKVGIADYKFKLYKFFSLPVEEFSNPSRAISRILILLDELNKYNFFALGFGLPGLINYRKGYIHYLVNLKDWKNVYWRKILEKETGIRTFLDNDVNLAALGEYFLGAGKGSKNMLMVTLGTGVGGGLILNGKIYRGSTYSAGEIGHFPLKASGSRCSCGGVACLESYIGNKKLMRIINTRSFYIKSQLLSRIKRKKGKLTLEDITLAGRKGDTLAIEFWEDVAHKLGQILTGVVNLLDVDRIIIGGGVANAGQLLFVPLRKFIKKRVMKLQGRDVKISKAGLREKAGVLGACILAYHGLKGRQI
ncbi:MAG: ROK family protein [Candidatus Omnitrophica bacterium]|nr:ROK family protein [Candidatus Omnitrophota bacterium]